FVSMRMRFRALAGGQRDQSQEQRFRADRLGTDAGRVARALRTREGLRPAYDEPFAAGIERCHGHLRRVREPLGLTSARWTSRIGLSRKPPRNRVKLDETERPWRNASRSAPS